MKITRQPGPQATIPKRKRRGLGCLGLIGVVILVIIVIAAVSSGKDKSATGTASSAPASVQAAASSAPTTEPAATQAPATTAPAVDPFVETYATFTTISRSGSSASVISLPSGFQGAVVTAKYSGSSNFVVQGLDSSNQSTGDLLVNTVGSYSGTTALIPSLGSTPTKLKIDASGPWTLKIAPVSTAPKLHLPLTGKADAVYLYTGDAASWTIKNKGSSNFVVQVAGDSPDVLVNEIGNYDGTVPTTAGPSVISIQSDGTWSITQS